MNEQAAVTLALLIFILALAAAGAWVLIHSLRVVLPW